MWLRRLLALATSLTNQGSESVSVPDGSGFLDRPRNIVVGVAELVGEELDLVRGLSNSIVNHSVASGGCETLFGCSRYEIELVDITICDSRVNHCAWHRILEGSHISAENSGVHSFANVDVHELSGTT
jgi:hypothetical protein